MPKLTPQQQHNIDQVAATMAIEDMPLTERAYKHLVQQATGEKTADQIAEEIKRKYTNE